MGGALFDRKGAADERAALFEGEGTVRVWDLLAGAAAPPFTAVLGCELEPGGRVGRHQQYHFPEIVVGLGGDGRARVDGVEHPLGLGDVVHLPLGSVLEIDNPGTTPLAYLIIKAR